MGLFSKITSGSKCLLTFSKEKLEQKMKHGTHIVGSRENNKKGKDYQVRKQTTTSTLWPYVTLQITAFQNCSVKCVGYILSKH